MFGCLMREFAVAHLMIVSNVSSFRSWFLVAVSTPGASASYFLIVCCTQLQSAAQVRLVGAWPSSAWSILVWPVPPRTRLWNGRDRTPRTITVSGIAVLNQIRELRCSQQQLNKQSDDFRISNDRMISRQTYSARVQERRASYPEPNSSGRDYFDICALGHMHLSRCHA